ncbi:MAG: sulfite exporter TauE/SafE family protein [Rubrivivax sp.]|nr:sulfite exporter TauE/SafE family protein [Rubrivivax sp.]
MTELVGLATADWAWVAGSVLVAYAVFGFGGFGAGIVGLPLIAHVMPLREAVPMTLLLDLVFSGWLGLRHHRLAQHRELLRLAPTLAVGMALGVVLLARAPEAWLVGVLGLFVGGYALHSLLSRAVPRPVDTIWALPTGLVGGVFTALYGTGGPVYTIYLVRRIADKARLRATTGTLVFAAALVRLALFTGGGFYAGARLPLLAATLLPLATVGYALGSRVHLRLAQDQVRRAIWMLLVASGASLLLRALAGA